MTQDLRSSLKDLVAEGPPNLVPHELAQAAWSQGRRRRRVRQLTIAALVLVVVGVGAVTVPLANHAQLFAPADGGGSSTVTGYPERIGHQWWLRDLPAEPGPMALLMQRVAHRDSYDQPLGWEAVSESGHRWRLPSVVGDDVPALSPDGRRLAYLSGVQGPYVLRDLVTGRTTTFPQIGTGAIPSKTKYTSTGQSPAYWSPDGRHLAMSGFRNDSSYTGRALVLGVDGSVHLLRGRGFPAGWADSSTIVWLSPTTYRAHKPAPLPARFTDILGRVKHSLSLDTPMRTGTLHQSSGAVSPNGAEMLVVQSRRFDDLIRRFSLTDGRQIGRAMPLDNLEPVCPVALSRSTPVATVLDQDNGYPAQLSSTGAKRLVAIEPRLGSECVVWAANALDGTRQGKLFGLSMVWWTWWWREILLGALLLVGLVWFARRRVAAQRRRSTWASTRVISKEAQ
jgi:hypothetical protein